MALGWGDRGLHSASAIRHRRNGWRAIARGRIVVRKIAIGCIGGIIAHEPFPGGSRRALLLGGSQSGCLLGSQLAFINAGGNRNLPSFSTGKKITANGPHQRSILPVGRIETTCTPQRLLPVFPFVCHVESLLRIGKAYT